MRPWFWGVAVLLLAALLRFGALTTIPHTLWVDETWFEWRAEQVRRGVDPLPVVDKVFKSGTGPVMLYTTALVQTLGWTVPYSARVGSAMYGLLSVAALYALLVRLLRGQPRRHFAALAGAGLWATHLTALVFSRDGNPNSSGVFFSLLALYALYIAFEQLSWRHALAFGLCTTFALISYDAALGLPLILGAYLAIRWVQGVGQRQRLLYIGALCGGALLLTFAPVAWYYSLHPEVGLIRVLDTNTMRNGSALADALNGYARVWAGVFVPGMGDAHPGQNLAGRPLLDPWLALWGAIGVFSLLRLVRQSAAQLTALWLLIFAIPSAVTAFPPSFGRLIIFAPGVITLVSWGLAQVPLRRALGVLGVSLLISSGFAVYAYFVTWHTDSRLFDARQIGARRTIDLALAQPNPTLLTEYANPMLYYAFDIRFPPSSRFTPFDAKQSCFPYPNHHPQPITFAVLTGFDSTPLTRLQQAYPNGEEIGYVMHPSGYAYSVFWRIPAGAAAPTPQHPTHIELDGGLQLTGYSLSTTTAHAGDTVTVTFYWTVADPLPAPLTTFIHIGRGPLSDPMLGQLDAPLCPAVWATRWQPGFTYIETQTVTLQAEAPAGEYDVRVGVYRPTDFSRLTIVAADVPSEANRLILSPLTVLP